MGQSPEKGRHRASCGHLPVSRRTKLFLATMYDNSYGVLPTREAHPGLSVLGALVLLQLNLIGFVDHSCV